jgi:hypothetical protein
MNLTFTATAGTPRQESRNSDGYGRLTTRDTANFFPQEYRPRIFLGPCFQGSGDKPGSRCGWIFTATNNRQYGTSLEAKAAFAALDSGGSRKKTALFTDISEYTPKYRIGKFSCAE